MNLLKRMPIVMCFVLLAVAGLAASPLVTHSKLFRAASAPSAPGTTGYPINAFNGTDIWGLNGPVTLKTTSLAGLVANTPVNVIAASAGKQIVVVGYNVSSNVAGSTVVFQDEAQSPVIYDGCTFAANDHIQVWRNYAPVFVTSSGAALDIAITGTSDVVKGSITYYYQ